MNAERILPTQQQLQHYSSQRYFRLKKARKPISAVTFDYLDLSKPASELQTDTTWLISHISSLPDDEVTAKMRTFTNSIADIDDAVAEKVFIEAI